MPDFFTAHFPTDMDTENTLELTIDLDRCYCIVWDKQVNGRACTILGQDLDPLAFGDIEEQGDAFDRIYEPRDRWRLKTKLVIANRDNDNWLHLKSGLSINIDKIRRVVWDGFFFGGSKKTELLPATHVYINDALTNNISLGNREDRLALRKKLVGDDWQPN